MSTTPREPTHRPPAPPGAVLVFDGACALCDAAVQAVIARDPEGRFRFATAESAAGRRLLSAHGVASEATRTVVLIEDGRAWLRSDAVLRVAARLRGPVRLLAWARVVPRALRDGAYDLVARHRRRRSACPVPSPGLRARLL